MPLWSNLIKRLYNDTSVCILPGKDSNYSTASLKAQTEPNCPWISPTSPQRIFPLLCIVQRIRITRFVSLRGSNFTHSYASSAFISVMSSSANKPPRNSRKYAVYLRFNLCLLKENPSCRWPSAPWSKYRLRWGLDPAGHSDLPPTPKLISPLAQVPSRHAKLFTIVPSYWLLRPHSLAKMLH